MKCFKIIVCLLLMEISYKSKCAIRFRRHSSDYQDMLPSAMNVYFPFYPFVALFIAPPESCDYPTYRILPVIPIPLYRSFDVSFRMSPERMSYPRGVSSTPGYSHTTPTVSSRRRSPSALFDPTTHPNWKLVNNEKCGISLENRIVGGINAGLGQYPWLARVGYTDERKKTIIFRCGATLISELFVVTAAHCAINLPNTLVIRSIRLGEYDTRTKIDCLDGMCSAPHEDFDIEQVLVHRNYGIPRNANDIALIKLRKAVKFSNWISPLCLPYGKLLSKNLTGSKVDIAGWGYYDVSIPKASDVVQTIKLPVLPIGSCARKYRRFSINQTNQLCVGGERGKDSCHGDSGGPLMKVEAEGDDGPRFYIFGIVSFGPTYCGLSPNPAVYTRVVSYLQWILDNMSVS